MSKIKDALFGAADKKSVEEAIESGGGSAGGVFIVNATPANADTFTPDKTFGETLEAFNAGKQVIVKIRITVGGEEAKVDCYMTVYNKTTQAEALIGTMGSHSQINFHASGIIDMS